MLAFHGAQAPPGLADQRARVARAPLHRPLGAGGQLLHRADRGPSPWIRQHADPAAHRAAHPARHRPHARPLHLRDQRALVLVRRVLREGILGRGILVGVLRRDRLRAHLLGGERPRVRPSAHRRGAARGAPLAESGGLRAQRGAKYAICPLCTFISPFPLRAFGIIQRLFREDRIWIRRAIPRTLLRSTIPPSRWISSGSRASRRKSRRARPFSPKTGNACLCSLCPTGSTCLWTVKSAFTRTARPSPSCRAARFSARWPRWAGRRAARRGWRSAIAG